MTAAIRPARNSVTVRKDIRSCTGFHNALPRPGSVAASVAGAYSTGSRNCCSLRSMYDWRSRTGGPRKLRGRCPPPRKVLRCFNFGHRAKTAMSPCRRNHSRRASAASSARSACDVWRRFSGTCVRTVAAGFVHGPFGRPGTGRATTTWEPSRPASKLNTVLWTSRLTRRSRRRSDEYRPTRDERPLRGVALK
jgi:hypothetical protein